MHHIKVIKDGNVNNVVNEQLVDGVQYVDNEPIKRSNNAVTSGGVAVATERVSSNIAPAYTNKTYEANSYVMHDGILYTNENAIAVAENWTPAHWTQTTVAEIFAAIFVEIGDVETLLAAL